MKLRIRAKEGLPIGLHGYHRETRDRNKVHIVYTTKEEANSGMYGTEGEVYFFPKGHHNYWIKKEHCDIVGEPIIGGELVE